MLGRILTATDFSAAGARAVRVAASWAERHGAALRIVHAVPPRRWLGVRYPGTNVRSRIAGGAAEALKRAVASLELPAELEVSTGIVEGGASRAVLREAEAFGAELLVVGARGEHDVERLPAGLGGTAAKLVRDACVPLLLVRRAPERAPPVVVAAVDLSPASSAVLQWAATAARGEPVRILHAYAVDFADRLAAYGFSERALEIYTADEHAARERALAALLPARLAHSKIIVTRGDAARVLYEAVREADATCVVLGKHGWTRRRPSTGYGSVCRYATEHLACDVLVVPREARTPTA